jgi:hypothetical protein
MPLASVLAVQERFTVDPATLPLRTGIVGAVVSATAATTQLIVTSLVPKPSFALIVRGKVPPVVGVPVNPFWLEFI